jgi:hypothetical protein
MAIEVVVCFDDEADIRVYAKGCCEPTTAAAQRLLDVEVNPADAEWRRWPV